MAECHERDADHRAGAAAPAHAVHGDADTGLEVRDDIGRGPFDECAFAIGICLPRLVSARSTAPVIVVRALCLSILTAVSPPIVAAIAMAAHKAVFPLIDISKRRDGIQPPTISFHLPVIPCSVWRCWRIPETWAKLYLRP